MINRVIVKKCQNNVVNKSDSVKTIRIYTRRIAVELRKKGFKIITTEPNYKKPQLDVYLFEDSEEFRSALHSLSNIR